MDQSDRLLYQVMKGDRRAQRLLYEQYKGRWLLICMRYNSNRQDAQDCLQNALVRIYTSLSQFDRKKGEFSSWSARIVINENLQFLKSKKKNIFLTELEFTGAQEEEVELDEELSLEKLTFFLQKLPAGYSAVFNLYAIEGYNHQEIAEILDISVGTSKSQLSRARNMLKKQIELHLNSA